MTHVLLWVVLAVAPTSVEIDPAAVAALQKMTTCVRELTALSVKALVEIDEVESGQKVSRTSTIQLTIHRPNRLRADVQTERTLRQLFYDGKSFTIWSPRAGYYASANAPGTIASLVTFASERYAIDLPFAEVFPWEHFDAGQLSGATDLGRSSIDGVECAHFAFRQQGLDWELWIDRDALPRKVQLTSTGENPQPDRRVTYTWGRELSGEETQFTFTPPKDARKIELKERAQ